MNAIDMDSLGGLIAEHYEVYSKRPPDSTAVAAWFRTLKPLSLDSIKMGLLIHSRHGKYPATPAHIFEIAQTQQELGGDGPKTTSEAAQKSQQFWHANDLLMAAHVGWVRGQHAVRSMFDAAMVNAVAKAKEESPDEPLPDAMRSLIKKLPGNLFPKSPAAVS